jgi:hypothetical protein
LTDTFTAKTRRGAPACGSGKRKNCPQAALHKAAKHGIIYCPQAALHKAAKHGIIWLCYAPEIMANDDMGVPVPQ